MRWILVVLAAWILSGCITPSYNYRAESVNLSEPPLNSVNTAFVGDVLLRQGKYREHEAIYLPNKVDISWSYDLQRGLYLKQGEDHKVETYLPGGSEPGRIEKSGLADSWKALVADKRKPTLCVVTALNTAVCKDDVTFERRTTPILSDDTFQQTLIYSGRVGNKINIGYREFSNNLARPAFNNDVEYDMNESRIIGYKGARIEVLSATNEKIEYRVLQNFNRAEH